LSKTFVFAGGVVSGTSIDWATEVARSNIVYAYELRDVGQFGFVLPPDQIIPNALETFPSMLTIVEEAHRRGYA
jgi:Zinc carboxypeptidase